MQKWNGNVEAELRVGDDHPGNDEVEQENRVNHEHFAFLRWMAAFQKSHRSCNEAISEISHRKFDENLRACTGL